MRHERGYYIARGSARYRDVRGEYPLYSRNASGRRYASWNTDGVRVDKDLFKAGALLDAYALLPFILRPEQLENPIIEPLVGTSEEKRRALSNVAATSTLVIIFAYGIAR